MEVSNFISLLDALALIFIVWFTGLNRGEGARNAVVSCAVTLPQSVTLGTSFPDVCVSAWVLWCPILFSGANVLHHHSADRVRIQEGEQVNICQTLKITRALEKISTLIFIYGKATKKRKERTKGLKLLSWSERHVTACEGNLCPVPWRSATFPLHLCHTTVLDTSALGEVAQIPASSWRQELQIYIAAQQEAS